MLEAQEPVRRQGCLKSDYPQAFPASRRGGPLAIQGDLEARGAVHWMPDKVHILENELDEKSTGQRSLTYPWDAL